MAHSNPKLIQALKDGKTPLEYLVYSVLPGDALVHMGGAIKYGIRNWLIDKILASTYEGAMLRHFTAWAGGQDIDPESGHHHLYHVRACCAIVLDADMNDTLIDDRDRCESIDQQPAKTDFEQVGTSLHPGAYGTESLTLAEALTRLRSPRPPIGEDRPERERLDFDLSPEAREFIDPFDQQKAASEEISKLNPISEIPLIK